MELAVLSPEGMPTELAIENPMPSLNHRVSNMQPQHQNAKQFNRDYFSYWHQEKLRRNLIAQEHRAKARAILPQLINILIDQFHVTQIILFGSLVRGNFDSESDLDLAVAGLAPQDFFRAYVILNDHSPFPIDLKPLESLDASFRIKVERMGECLYAKYFSNDDR